MFIQISDTRSYIYTHTCTYTVHTTMHTYFLTCMRTYLHTCIPYTEHAEQNVIHYAHYIRPYFLFLCSGGYVLVNCAPAPDGSSFHLVIDYLTDAVLKKSEIGGSFYLSPDARHLVVVGNQTLSA